MRIKSIRLVMIRNDMKLLRAFEVAEKFNESVAYFNRFIKCQPKFPKPHKSHPKARPQWEDAEINEYMKRKLA